MSTFVEETIAFSICKKPFKPLELPSGRMKSRGGYQTKTSTQTHGSDIMSKFNKVNIIPSLRHQKSINS
jgi:hypothetical protein